MRRGARRSLVRVFSLTERFYPLAGGINVTNPTYCAPFGPGRLGYVGPKALRQWDFVGSLGGGAMGVIEELNRRSEGALPGLIGMEIVDAGEGSVSSRLELREELLAPNGYLHAATVVALADTSCGYGTFVSLPEGASGFTTIELKSNFLGTARQGVDRLRGAARARRAQHAGVGRDRHGRGEDHRALPLHADDPVPALARPRLSRPRASWLPRTGCR